MTTPTRIVCVTFPVVTQLDLTGPAQVFARMPNIEVEYAWHRVEPVSTDCGFSIVPTTTFEDAGQADVLFVPGGAGAFDLFDDEVALDFIRTQAAGARFVTSVCTGSFALGAAGLLAGRRATSHWGSLSLLEEFGAIPVSDRVVRDGNIITGAGVSSGIDFALSLTAELFGEKQAKRIQLGIEYDPAPPFDAGSPHRPGADQEQVAAFRARMREVRGDRVRRAAEKLAASGRG